jgi:hypothetical protein
MVDPTNFCVRDKFENSVKDEDNKPPQQQQETSRCVNVRDRTVKHVPKANYEYPGFCEDKDTSSDCFRNTNVVPRTRNIKHL